VGTTCGRKRQNNGKAGESERRKKGETSNPAQRKKGRKKLAKGPLKKSREVEKKGKESRGKKGGKRPGGL